MINVMLGIMAKSNPPVSSVIDCKEVSYRDLSMVEIRYVQSNSYIAARAYHTATWIAPTPMGPVFNEDGTLKMDNIEDIAKLDFYPSANALRGRRWPSMDELVQLQKELDGASLEMIRSTYPGLNDLLYKTSFSFTPVPTVQICLAEGKRFKSLVGTIALDVYGNVQVTSKVRNEVEEVARQMRGLGQLSLAEGLGYE